MNKPRHDDVEGYDEIIHIREVRIMLRRILLGILVPFIAMQAYAQETPAKPPESSPPKSRIVKVAILQQPSWKEGKTPEEQRKWQMDWILQQMEEAGKAKADIACMGEDAVEMEGLTLPDCAPLNAIRDQAKKHNMYVIFPVVAKREEVLRNTAVMIGRDGSILGYYDKVHPTQTERQKGVVPGDNFPVFQLDFGTVAVQICHDLSFPESSRVEMLKGAELVFWPTWWGGWGQELDWIVIRCRAIDNDAFLAVVSRGIKPGEGWRPRDPIGQSGIINPYGHTLSNIGYEPGLIVTEIDLSQRRIAPNFSSNAVGEKFRESVLQDRNPKAYRIIGTSLSQ